MKPPPRWQFWVDRGGTFTDLIARHPDGRLDSLKLLSENPEHYQDAVLEGIRQLLGLPAQAPIPSATIECIRIGTTVATNALLERKGADTMLVTTRGFADALQIAYQNRPDLFALDIRLPEPLYCSTLEVEERLSADGSVLTPLCAEDYLERFIEARRQGVHALAVVLMHACRNPAHELALARIAEQAGFEQISLSHQVSPLIKLVGRGDTTVIDAYVGPVLARYTRRLAAALPETRLLFMQSSGGLIDAVEFRACNSLLSGPAGGVVGGVKTAAVQGVERLVGFDMGGTSTDVWHYSGDYERVYETQLAGSRLRVPMLDIHTVAAGGGSICSFDGLRLRVGPESAGADPGPASYSRGGPLTLTDCNLLLGRLHPEYFPAVFGPERNSPLNAAPARERAEALLVQVNEHLGLNYSIEALAAGFIDIAVQNMAGAVKTISTQRGHDLKHYTLSCFGGAGGQHACAVAEVLGLERILLHPQAALLSALGMGLADISSVEDRSLNWSLAATEKAELKTEFETLRAQAARRLTGGAQLKSGAILEWRQRVHLRYQGSDTTLPLLYTDLGSLLADFEELHRRRFSFVQKDKPVMIDSIGVEAILAGSAVPADEGGAANVGEPSAVQSCSLYINGELSSVELWPRSALSGGRAVSGPVLVVEENTSTLVAQGWRARVLDDTSLELTRLGEYSSVKRSSVARDPVLLELFNYRFMAIAEQMGAVLANTAHSVNIKERFDFSCALFDRAGSLVANAPHVPVHLGSMDETVKAVCRNRGASLRAGDACLINSPYAGGTHLPDLTVVSPVFVGGGLEADYFVATRAHHADIGGSSPGSMPAQSRHIDEEGVLFEDFLLVEGGEFCEPALRAALSKGPYPARNVEQNIADLQAQVAANACGIAELSKLAEEYGAEVVEAYMAHVQDNAEEAVRALLPSLRDGDFVYEMDGGDQIAVSLRVKGRDLKIDFSGTSPQSAGNFNAPAAVGRAAVLYVLRSLVSAPIPLNAGCLRPVELVIPAGSLLNPRYPAAVVAGNVETSQYVVDTLFGALGVLAGSQGTMNNLAFGNAQYQYYETLCGGAGAGRGFAGASAVQVHMTNSRLTDPEILELRFPVRVESFSIRRGSGGVGEFAGGDGIERTLCFLEPLTVDILSGHRRVPPFGLAGGGCGALGKNLLCRADGETVELPACVSVDVSKGDRISVYSPGGGGYGEA